MGIRNLLSRAREEIAVSLEHERKTAVVTLNRLPPPASRLEGIQVIGRLVKEAKWETAAPAFRAVQRWVEECWAEGRKTHPPEGTVRSEEWYGQRGLAQLDHPTAAKRLIAAAGLYGAETVAQRAEEFAAHGLIEVHTVYLLKGPPIAQEMRLDDYCALVPYREGRRRIFDAIAEALARDEDVSIVGFGRFTRKDRPAREGRNPRTGERIAIGPSAGVSFKAGKPLKDSLS